MKLLPHPRHGNPVQHCGDGHRHGPHLLVPRPDEADLPPELQGLFRKAREKIRFVQRVPHLCVRPERLSAWFAHFRLLHEETPG